MNNRLCPCGARLDRSSTTRSLKSTGLRMFMSMRTMISWPSDTKVCNICRLLYVKWKRENLEFSWFISLLEGENDGDDGGDESASVSVYRFSSFVYWKGALF